MYHQSLSEKWEFTVRTRLYIFGNKNDSLINKFKRLQDGLGLLSFCGVPSFLKHGMSCIPRHSDSLDFSHSHQVRFVSTYNSSPPGAHLQLFNELPLPPCQYLQALPECRYPQAFLKRPPLPPFAVTRLRGT